MAAPGIYVRGGYGGAGNVHGGAHARARQRAREILAFFLLFLTGF